MAAPCRERAGSFCSHAAGLCPLVRARAARRVGSEHSPARAQCEDIPWFARACDWMKHDILMLWLAENMGPGDETPYDCNDPRLFRSLSCTNPSWPPALPAAFKQRTPLQTLYDPRLRQPLAMSTMPSHPPAQLVLHNKVRLHLICHVMRAKNFCSPCRETR